MDGQRLRPYYILVLTYKFLLHISRNNYYAWHPLHIGVVDGMDDTRVGYRIGLRRVIRLDTGYISVIIRILVIIAYPP